MLLIDLYRPITTSQMIHVKEKSGRNLTCVPGGFVVAPLVAEIEPAFGEVVRHLRVSRKWSHDTLARHTGLSKGGLINIEKLHEPQVKPITLEALAQAFKITSTELLRLYEERKAGVAGGSIVVDGMSLDPAVVKSAAAVAKAQGVALSHWIAKTIEAAVAEKRAGGTRGGRSPLPGK